MAGSFGKPQRHRHVHSIPGSRGHHDLRRRSVPFNRLARCRAVHDAPHAFPTSRRHRGLREHEMKKDLDWREEIRKG